MFSIVIPVYNEQENLEKLRERIFAAALAWNSPFEVILVDDGSTDRTLCFLRALHQKARSLLTAIPVCKKG